MATQIRNLCRAFYSKLIKVTVPKPVASDASVNFNKNLHKAAVSMSSNKELVEFFLKKEVKKKTVLP